MANKFEVISKKFYNEFRNILNPTTDNPTEFTNRMQGNTGEIVRLVEQIEIGTIVNKSQTINIQFFELAASSYCKFTAPLLDFVQEGLYEGASLLFEFDNTTVTATCDGITGFGNADLKIDSAGRTLLLAAGFVDGEIRQDIVIKLLSVPTYIRYNYGLTPNDSTSPNYLSPLDNNTQGYQLSGITGSFQDMTWIGNEIGVDFGTVKIKFDATINLFNHQFTVEHTFKIPYYEEGQQVNLSSNFFPLNPALLIGQNTLKYGNGFFFGGTTSITVLQYEDLGGVGNVGYFDENFNGLTSNYTVENLVITNSSSTGTIEATLVNTLTFDVVSTGGNWVAGVSELIFTHSKLPTSQEYSNQLLAFDTIWLFENIRSTEGAAPASNLGGMISAFEFDIDGGDPAKLNVTLKLTYNTARQALILNTSDYLLYVTSALNDLTDPDLMDRVNTTVQQTLYTKDLDITALVTNFTPDIFNHWDFDTGTKKFTNFDGWDGDLIGIAWQFETDVTRGAIVKDFKFHLGLDNGSFFFPMLTISIKLATITVDVTSGGNTYAYQVVQSVTVASFNMSASEVLNRVELTAVIPATATATQTWTGKLGFRVSWRDWIENLNVPTQFIDYTEPNDNRNEKTSNYSGIDGYEVKAIIEMNMGNSEGADTIYLLTSDISSILDFDDAGGSSFSAVTKFYDANGLITDNIFTNQTTRIEIEFSHTLGTLIVGNLWGRVWIEPDQSTQSVWDLSTDKDFTDANNLLQPTDTLVTGNTQFVEVVSVLNKVTLICQTNQNNLVEGVLYNVYGRLGNKL